MRAAHSSSRSSARSCTSRILHRLTKCHTRSACSHPSPSSPVAASFCGGSGCAPTHSIAHASTARIAR